MVNDDNWLVMWEQLDLFRGLQQVRGLNGQPGRVAKTGLSRYMMQPGVYGEFATIDEFELTTRRAPGTFGNPIDISDLVVMEQSKLLQRRLDRIETIIWTLLTTGTFSVAGPAGAVLHTDSYTPQSFTATVSWATPATSTPLADLRAVQLLARGYSIRFDTASKLYMNLGTVNKMLANTNAADLGGRRGAGLSTLNSLPQINQLLMMDGLPAIVPYDRGYYPDPSGAFTLFIPDNKAVLIGERTDGANVGEYALVRNANNPGLGPGAYTKVIDNSDRSVPRTIEVHDGHNGGPKLLFPSAVVQLNL